MLVFAPNVALLIIDMINDFVSKDGVTYVPGAEKIIPTIKQMSDEARSSESPVIYICDSSRPSNMGSETWSRHAEDGMPGSEIVPQLSPVLGDFVIIRRRYSSFFGTDLDLLLKELGVRKLVLTGTATDIGIYFAAADAYTKGYQITIPRKCVVALSETDQEAILEQMEQLFHAEVI